MKITILYDNTTTSTDLIADWGFACLVDTGEHRLLFDTGASPDILRHNMERLGITAADIRDVAISHAHWDHTGGLAAVAGNTGLRVHAPDGAVISCGAAVQVSGPAEILPGIFSTGPLAGAGPAPNEQALVLPSPHGSVVITGCAHPGIPAILDAAAPHGRTAALIGGFHGFDDIGRFDGIGFICPTHCTRHAAEIRRRFPEACRAGGVGTVLSPLEGIFPSP